MTSIYEPLVKAFGEAIRKGGFTVQRGIGGEVIVTKEKDNLCASTIIMFTKQDATQTGDGLKALFKSKMEQVDRDVNKRLKLLKEKL